MSSLRDIIKDIQAEIGVERDGVFGPVSAGAVLAALRARHADPQVEVKAPATTVDAFRFDDRTERCLASLDPKAEPAHREFLSLSQATAATMGCEIKIISGARSYEEQERLYQKYQAGGPKAAAPGNSWHEYKLACDYGIFQGGIYCDDAKPALALAVYRAIQEHAKKCGLEWGGNWKGRSCDPPHFQKDMGSSSPTAAHKRLFKEKGSVL